MWDVMDEELIGKRGRSQGMPKLSLWPIGEPVWFPLLWSGRATVSFFFLDVQKIITDQEETDQLVPSNQTDNSAVWICPLKPVAQIFRINKNMSCTKVKVLYRESCILCPCAQSKMLYMRQRSLLLGKDTKETEWSQQKLELSDVSPSYFKSAKQAALSQGHIVGS